MDAVLCLVYAVMNNGYKGLVNVSSFTYVGRDSLNQLNILPRTRPSQAAIIPTNTLMKILNMALYGSPDSAS